MANVVKVEGREVALLPDNAQWRNRFEIPSSSSDRVYTVAQRKSDGSWGCSCPGWIRHKNCKHLKALAPHLRTLEARAKTPAPKALTAGKRA